MWQNRGVASGAGSDLRISDPYIYAFHQENK